ncbi:hypothetical protein ABIB90_008352, partial [Bradyrhizobium sp. JR4.1]
MECAVIKRELRRRSSIEPVIGHLKTEGHLGRCHLKGRSGDAANVVLSAVGYNFRRVLAWLRELLCIFLVQLCRTIVSAIFSARDTRVFDGWPSYRGRHLTRSGSG